MVAKETLVATVRYDTTTIALWAKSAIAHAEVEAISDPAGYFATVPACKGAWACGPTPEAAIRELERHWLIGPKSTCEPGTNHPYLPWTA